MNTNEDDILLSEAPFKNKSIINEAHILRSDMGIHPKIDYRCPRCDSGNVTLEEFDLHYRFYRCDSCGFTNGGE